MISTGELKKGVAIELDGELWQILDYHHIKMGRGSAQVRITLRNIKRGQTVERSFQAGTKWPRASMEKRPVQFLYRDDRDYHFMDNDTYDQFVLTADQLGDTAQYLKDGMTLDRTSYQGETIGVEVPVTVDLAVVETEPGFAGDTQSGARKPATTETGLDRPGPDLRRARGHHPRRHPDRGVPDPALMASRAGIEALLYLLDEAFRGRGIEESDESQALLPNLATVPQEVVAEPCRTERRARSRRSSSMSEPARSCTTTTPSVVGPSSGAPPRSSRGQRGRPRGTRYCRGWS